MKETCKTSRTAGYLEKIFRKANAKWFNNELEEPIITIQSTPKCYGHVTVAKDWTRGKDGEQRHELNIGAEYLTRPIEEVVATMIHEMVHLYNLKNNIQDCSRGGSYHNKKFKEKAEKCGLIIEHHNTYGWTITKPSDELVEWCIEEQFEEICMCKGVNIFTTGGSFGGNAGGLGKPINIGKPKGNSRKYACPMCKISVRATRDLTGHIKCAICDQYLIEC